MGIEIATTVFSRHGLYPLLKSLFEPVFIIDYRLHLDRL